MKLPEFIVIKEKKSPLKAIIITVSAVIAVLAAAAVVYKLYSKKIKSMILGRVDIDGDGEADAIMLDTTGNGEIDTIIISSEPDEDEE